MTPTHLRPATTLPASLAQALQDRYRFDRELGRGGMATVYLAHDLKHERPVALKVLHPELAAALGPERFQREIRFAARLQHPHILPVHDSGDAGGQLWFTMPFVEGESLRDRLRREVQLPVEEATRIAAETGRALDYAHRHGVIHRDVKPENILITREGHSLLADFGIARALGGTPEDHGSGAGASLTATGTSVGTPAYMSPEQASGDRHIDTRSDVYSLGIVLYEMLAGEPPFTGPTAQAIIAKRFAHDAPPVRQVRPSVPPSVEDAIRRALERTPADRFATAGEFADAVTRPGARAAATPSGATVVITPVATARRQLPRAAVLAALLLLLGLGVLVAWRGLRNRSDRSTGSNVLAVLPFENLGDSTDAYFADGVANDLRSRLSQVAGLTVIARSSSNEYRQSGKPLREIARELGADYLLTATVQWDKAAGETSRVRVTPELVRIRPGHSPESRWGQAFDAPMRDVFQVQADIASQVAQALHVALGDSAKRMLATQPTRSVPAYDAFLRGEADFQSGAADSRALREAVAAYEQAVAIDSMFALAWARLAQARAVQFFQGPTPAMAEAARLAAERARVLAPNRSEAHQALGAYYGMVLGDYKRARVADSTASALSPGNAELLGYAAWDDLTMGRWEEARRQFEQAVRTDPRAGLPAGGLSTVLLYTRRYREAAQFLDERLRSTPDRLSLRQMRVLASVGQGDLAAARAVIDATPKEVDPTALVAFVGSADDLCWVLDDARQQLLLRLRPSAFDDDLAAWGIVLAQSWAFRGDMTKARVYADSARRAFEMQLKDKPESAPRHAMLGLALAYLGDHGRAVQETKRAMNLVPIERDAQWAPYFQHQLARVYLLGGEPDKALDQLEAILKIPYYLSPAWLRIDPNFEALRGNPRFERLAAAPVH